MGGKQRSEKCSDINLFDCRFLGKGHNGTVYQLPGGKAIKICYVMKDFYGEVAILRKVRGSKYFPKLYEVGGNYMIRDYVDGLPLNKYIKRNGLSRKLVLDILDLLKEFERLKFKKLDIRCKDVFVEPDGRLKVIDPQKFYTKDRSFPQHLSKGLYKLGVLEDFLLILRQTEPGLYRKWIHNIRLYIEQKKMEEDE